MKQRIHKKGGSVATSVKEMKMDIFEGLFESTIENLKLTKL